MIYILWGLLNLALVVLLLFLFVRAVTYLKLKYGTAIAVLFTFVFMSFKVNHYDNEFVEGDQKPGIWNIASMDQAKKNLNYNTSVTLDKTLFVRHMLHINYTEELTSTKHIPINAWNSVTGFQMGTQYTPKAIAINQGENNTAQYEVYGTVTWSLLGIPVYHQEKHWKGEALLK